MPLLGSYIALGTRVVILGLAAMSVNFLLGFTGVLSFGHAAYFGLGAYGTGLALKHLTSSTSLALIAGTLLGGVIGAILGALIPLPRHPGRPAHLDRILAVVLLHRRCGRALCAPQQLR